MARKILLPLALLLIAVLGAACGFRLDEVTEEQLQAEAAEYGFSGIKYDREEIKFEQYLNIDIDVEDPEELIDYLEFAQQQFEEADMKGGVSAHTRWKARDFTASGSTSAAQIRTAFELSDTPITAVYLSENGASLIFRECADSTCILENLDEVKDQVKRLNVAELSFTFGENDYVAPDIPTLQGWLKSAPTMPLKLVDESRAVFPHGTPEADAVAFGCSHDFFRVEIDIPNSPDHEIDCHTLKSETSTK